MSAPIIAAAGLLLAAVVQEAPDTTRVYELRPVVVEVLRSPQPLSAVPFATTVVQLEDALRWSPRLALDEALRGIPGVQAENRHNYAVGERISIRGFGARTQFGVRGLRVLVDEIPATFADGQSALDIVNAAELGRVEVVRGPASALYGNAAGGVVHFRTRPPPTSPFLAEARLVRGGDGYQRLDVLSGGTPGRANVQTAFSHLASDGFREHSAAELFQGSVRAGWPLGAGELRLSVSGVDFRAENPGSLSDSLLAVDRRMAFAQNVAQGTGKEGTQGQAGVVWRAPLGGTVLTASAHLLGRDLVNPIPARIIDLSRRGGGARAILAAPAGRGFDLTVGAEWEGQWDDRRNHLNVQGERGALALDQAESVHGMGAFAHLHGRVAEPLALSLALRGDVVDFSVRDRFFEGGDPDDSGSRRLGALSPSVGLLLDAAPGVALFANLAGAFDTPTTTELANRPDGAGGFNPDLEPQRTLSTELGVRGESPLIGWEIVGFHARVRDALIPFQVPDAPGRDFFRNAASAVHRGAEASLLLRPARGMRLRAAYSWIDARFVDHEVRGVSFAGNQVPGVAPHRADLVLAWDAPLGVGLQADLRASAGTPANDANTQRSPSYTAADLRLAHRGWEVAGARFHPFIAVHNVTDARYDASVVVNAFGGRFHEPAPGRTLHVGGEISFGG
jgi:iron complex outermembrane recepter protein